MARQVDSEPAFLSRNLSRQGHLPELLDIGNLDERDFKQELARSASHSNGSSLRGTLQKTKSYRRATSFR